jgi:hypothetical protein
MKDELQKTLKTYEKLLKATTSNEHPSPGHMKSCEKPLKTVKQMQNIIHHMRWYEIYEKLWKHMKIDQNRRRTADSSAH